MITTWRKRACLLAAAAVLSALAVPQTAGPASAATSTISTKSMLSQLVTASEHTAGYDRAKFTLWTDADHDGCDTRDEVLIQEATTRPHVGAGCALTGGRWRSRYDGVTSTDPSGFDIDHLVPLNEAWQSGAWNWSSATRKAYANDLGYRADLIAVTAHENRSKGDQEPQDWMPERTAYACTYVKQWVAVKWRWHLKVNAAERTFLTSKLATCGWPLDPRPTRPSITTGGTVTTTPTPTPTQTTGSGTVSYAVHPGAFCSEHWQYGYTSTGTRMRCTTTATDSSFRWRSAS
jgi:hypothetical protein